MQDACVVPEQGELPLGDNVVRLCTSPSRDVAEAREEFEKQAREHLETCPNMVAFYFVSVDGDGRAAAGGYRTSSCKIPQSMMPEVMRNAVLLRLAKE